MYWEENNYLSDLDFLLYFEKSTYQDLKYLIQNNNFTLKTSLIKIMKSVSNHVELEHAVSLIKKYCYFDDRIERI